MKPKLKPPGTKRFKLKCDILLSTSAFKFDLRRYILDKKYALPFRVIDTLTDHYLRFTKAWGLLITNTSTRIAFKPSLRH